MTLRKAEPTMATQAPVAASTPARLIKPWTLPPQTSYLFKNANVVDTVEGVIRKQTVRLAEGLIQAVGDRIAAGSHDVVIDLEGKFLCPGLIDCHVHLSAVAGNASLAARAFPPDPAYPQMPQPQASPQRVRRRWPWYVGIGLVIWLGGAYYFYQDNEKTFAEARNRGVDIISTDEKTGVVTARDKQTGKIIRMDFNDIGADQVRVGTTGMPAWIPSYPNVTGSEAPQNGTFSLSTSDSVAEAAGFYETELRTGGMTVTRRNSPPGDSLDNLTLTAADDPQKRTATIVVQRTDAGSRIAITPGKR